MGLPRSVSVAITLALVGGVAAAEERNAPAPVCSGEYADDVAVLVPRVRDLERNSHYSHCLRTTATYECLSYASDGTVRRARKTVVAHGTAFAYKRVAGETFVVTNEHVAGWPAVTDDNHLVEDVPAGCKRVLETIKIVDDEEDGYDANDIVLTPVVADQALDAAILKTKAPLEPMPYRIGHSKNLRVGNAVAVRGFPLGAFAATNVGKVVNTYDHDTSKDWDHVDFVTDALLSPGNSGSPVLAVSCKTGQYELVGMYHAGYVRGAALNVVVGIDQLRDLMLSFKRSPRTDTAEKLDAAERDTVRTLATPSGGGLSFFPFGPLVAAVHLDANGGLIYEVFARGFPLAEERLLVVEDLPARESFGTLGRVYVGNRRGLRRLERAGLDADAQAHLDKILTRLRVSAVATARFRAATPTTQKGAKRRAAIERQRDRQTTQERDAATLTTELAERLGPRSGDPVVAIAELLPSRLAPPPPPPLASAPRK